MVQVSPTPDPPPVVFITEKSPIFPSTRFMLATVLCLCFMSLAVATSNISQAMVCMVPKKSTNELFLHNISSRSANFDPIDNAIEFLDGDNTNETKPCKRSTDEMEDGVTVTKCSAQNTMNWTSLEQGFVYAAQNLGSMFMLVTGWHADRLNSKWTICLSLTLLIIANSLIPTAAHISVWCVFGLRIMTGLGDALLFPSASSLITRWFPAKERPFALGFVTGGRQLGSLLILPVGGKLCEKNGMGGFTGWPAIFYLSAIIGSGILLIWLFLSADKPSKHCCIVKREREYIERKIDEEKIGKRTERGSPPYAKMMRCAPLYVAIAALVCHEFPLVIMLQYLPKFFSDVLNMKSSDNGLASSLPMICLFISKTISSSLSSVMTARKPPILGRTASCKLFNFIASLGLGVCIGITPLLTLLQHPAPVIIVLCLANAFAGLHTPGVQTALLQLAPCYSGVITGISFAVVNMFSISNKLISSTILQQGTTREWTIVFEISAVIALLPVVFFTIWGSAERQPWASSSSALPNKEADQQSQDSSDSGDRVLSAFAKYSLFLTHDLGQA